MEEEEERWNKAVASYEDFIGELKAELAAVDKVLEVFASADISDEMLERIDWWSRVNKNLYYDIFRDFEINKFIIFYFFKKLTF